MSKIQTKELKWDNCRALYDVFDARYMWIVDVGIVNAFEIDLL